MRTIRHSALVISIVVAAALFALAACDLFNGAADKPRLDRFVMVVPGALAGEAEAAASTAAPRSSAENPGGIFEPAREATKIARRATQFTAGLLATFQTKIVQNDALWGILVNTGVLEHEDLEGGTRVKLTRVSDDYVLQYWKGDAKLLHLSFSRDGGNWNGSLIASFTPDLWTVPIMLRVDFNAPTTGYRSSTVSLTGLDGDPEVTADTPNVPVSAVIDLSEQADGFLGVAGTISYANAFGDDVDPLATYYRSYLATGTAVSASSLLWEKPVAGAYVYRGRAKGGQAAADFALTDEALSSVSASTFQTNDIASVVEAAAVMYVRDDPNDEFVEDYSSTVEWTDEEILALIEQYASDILGWALGLENHVYFTDATFVGTDGAGTAPSWAAGWAEGLADIPCTAPLDLVGLSISMPAAE